MDIDYVGIGSMRMVLKISIMMKMVLKIPTLILRRQWWDQNCGSTLLKLPSQSALYHHNNLLNISAALNYNELRIFSSF